MMAEDCGGENPADYELCDRCTSLEAEVERLVAASIKQDMVIAGLIAERDMALRSTGDKT